MGEILKMDQTRYKRMTSDEWVLEGTPSIDGCSGGDAVDESFEVEIGEYWPRVDRNGRVSVPDTVAEYQGCSLEDRPDLF